MKNLKFIRDSLIIFHRNKYNEDIKKITNILNEIENSSLEKLNNERTKKEIEFYVPKHKALCDEIEKMKDFLLFKKIFENAQGQDQDERFEDAQKK